VLFLKINLKELKLKNHPRGSSPLPPETLLKEGREGGRRKGKKGEGRRKGLEEGKGNEPPNPTFPS
jgi:hypothetical protein